MHGGTLGDLATRLGRPVDTLIEPEILPLTKALTEMDFKTIASSSGHTVLESMESHGLELTLQLTPNRITIPENILQKLDVSFKQAGNSAIYTLTSEERETLSGILSSQNEPWVNINYPSSNSALTNLKNLINEYNIESNVKWGVEEDAEYIGIKPTTSPTTPDELYQAQKNSNDLANFLFKKSTTPKITAAGAPKATFNVDLSFINNPDVAGTTYARPAFFTGELANNPLSIQEVNFYHGHGDFTTAFFTEGELANKPLSISETYGTTSKGQLITGYGIYSGTPTGISIFELSKIGNLNYINPQDIVSGAGKNSNAGSGGSTFYTTPSGQVIEQVNVRSNGGGSGGTNAQFQNYNPLLTIAQTNRFASYDPSSKYAYLGSALAEEGTTYTLVNPSRTQTKLPTSNLSAQATKFLSIQATKPAQSTLQKLTQSQRQALTQSSLTAQTSTQIQNQQTTQSQRQALTQSSLTAQTSTQIQNQQTTQTQIQKQVQTQTQTQTQLQVMNVSQTSTLMTTSDINHSRNYRGIPQLQRRKPKNTSNHHTRQKNAFSENTASTLSLLASDKQHQKARQHSINILEKPDPF